MGVYRQMGSGKSLMLPLLLSLFVLKPSFSLPIFGAEVIREKEICSLVVTMKSNRFSPSKRFSQSELLDAFNPKEISSFQRLGTKLVFRVAGAHDASYFLRLPSLEHSVQREAFILDLKRQHKNHLYIESRFLSEAESIEVVDELMRKGLIDESQAEEQRRLILEDGQRVGVAPGIDWPSGFEMSNSMVASMNLLWRVDVDQGFQVYSQLPESMQVQLADHWVFSNVFNIHDFHPDNWLSNGEDVVALDFGYVSGDHGATRLPVYGSLSPVVSDAGVSMQLADAMIARASASTLEKLKSLSEARLIELATRDSYQFEETELEGILARIRYLMERRDRLGDPNE